ncbi:MAG: hypothetical protein QM499_05955 [Flavobacteriaceae bacterium]
MKNIFLLVTILLITNFANAQEQKTDYYPNSTVLKEIGKLDKNGYPIGEWKYYLKEGVLDYKINWETNYIKKYYTTGVLKEEGTFIPGTGVHIGEWITYKEDGKIEAQKVFDENGVEIGNKKD